MPLAPHRAPEAPAPVAVVLLCAALVAGYAMELAIALRRGPAELDAFVNAFGLVPRELLAGRWHTLGTALFLHASPVHLLANLAFLVAFGLEVEPRLGAARFLALFLGAGLLAEGLHVAITPTSFVPALGASGAVSGVLGAWWRLGRDPAVPRTLARLPALALLALWLGAQLASALLSGSGAGEAAWAHLGGFAAGLVAAPYLARVRTLTEAPPAPRPGR